MPTPHMLKLMLLVLLTAALSYAQQKSTSVSLYFIDDESISISVDKPLYLPGDTVRLRITREDSGAAASVTPVVAIEGMRLRSIGRDRYVAIIPQNVTPGAYRVLLRIVDDDGRRHMFETGRVVAVEEVQAVERLSTFLRMVPQEGGNDPQSAVTLNRGEIRGLKVGFLRDSIRVSMGPQFVTIRTVVQTRDRSASQSFERRVMTFRSHGNPEKDRAMFLQYRTAYGAYAAISTQELDHVLLPLDSLPSWALIQVSIEPDYTIKIGAYDHSNAFTRFYRVRGPSIEVGFSLGIPKVLYDSRSQDTIEYGHTSAMVRFYHVSALTGHRFPVSLGIGTFGVYSPIDLGVGKGGFALSMFLDLVEFVRSFNVELTDRVNAGIELTPFFPIGKRGRVLLDAQVSIVL